MATSKGSTTIECGFCSRTDVGMEDPTKLPCDHIHCRSCLNTLHQSMGKVKCPNCRKEWDVKLDDLPSSPSDRHVNLCQICSKKKLQTPATQFCTHCCNKYCDKHLSEVHEEMCIGHDNNLTSIDEYKKIYKRIRRRHCSHHPSSPVGRGCKCCLEVYCSDCWSQLQENRKDKQHEGVVEVEKLASELTGEMQQLTVELTDKRGQFQDLFTQTNKSIADHDKCTEELVRVLLATRDAQIKEIEEKYEQLTEELLERRGKSKDCLHEFRSDKIVERWFDLNLAQQKLDSHLGYAHQVDIIKEHRQIKADIEKLVNEKLPLLLLDSTEMKYRAQSRDVEIELTNRNMAISLNNPYKESAAVTRGGNDASDEDDDEFFDPEGGPDELVKLSVADEETFAKEINNSFKSNKRADNTIKQSKRHRKRKK